MLEEEIVLDKKYKHDISVVVDRLVMRPRPAQAAGRLGGDRGRAGRRDRRGRDRAARRRRRSRSTTYSRALRLPALRDLDARARAALVLVQRAARRLPALHRASARRWRSTRSSWCRTRRCRSTRARSCRGRAGATSYYEQIAQAIAERYEVDLDAPWEDLPRGAAEPLPVRHQRRQAVRLLPQPDGPQAVVHDDLRGHRPEPRAPLQGDRLRLVAREDRGVHVGAAVPGVRGRAAAAGVAGGQGRRDGDPRVHAR